MRTCSRCGEAKPETKEYFSVHKQHLRGLNAKCKQCCNAAAIERKARDPEIYRAKQREAQARYRAAHPEKIKQETKLYWGRWRDANPEKVKEQRNRWRAANAEKVRAGIARWQASNRERVRELGRAWQAANPERCAARKARWLSKPQSREKLRLALKEWQKKNPEKYRAKRARRYQRIKAENGTLAISKRMSNAILISLKRQRVGGKGGRSWAHLVPYSLQELIAHIERQFTRGMTWQNWGPYWHLDHIIPVSSFKFTSADCAEFRACWALTNLRPLRAQENIRKSAKRTLLI